MFLELERRVKAKLKHFHTFQVEIGIFFVNW